MQPMRKPYPTDISDEDWPLVAPYLPLLREVFNALRWRAGASGRMLPTNLPLWEAVYQQTRAMARCRSLLGDGEEAARLAWQALIESGRFHQSGDRAASTLLFRIRFGS